MYTLIIYEAFGVKYDCRFSCSKQRAIKKVQGITPTAHIHYIETVPKTKLFKKQQKTIIRR
jgi:hypothetical protein